MAEQSQVGRYQIREIIGRGAMGVVYLAYDPQIGRRVALKTVRPLEGARPEEIAESKARFLREAQAAGKLLHPNIVTIFDVFEDRGVLYIAMEYVEGVLLDRFCSAKTLLPVEKTLVLVGQGLAALHYAHRNGIVHRDIKPSNLMVVDGETLKVMDFGVARQPGASLTQTGMVVGTPHYMSPEQIEGKLLDGRSDVFSMGVVLYEVLTGERPFQGEEISTVIYRILHSDPVPAREINPALPEYLGTVLQRALAKNVEDRFPTAKSFGEALQRYAEPQAAPSPREELPSSGLRRDDYLPPPPSSGFRRRRKHFSAPWKTIGLIALIVALVGGAWVARGFLQQRDSGKGIGIAESPSHQMLPRVLTVVTDPPGAKLFVDGQPTRAVLAPGAGQRPRILEARLGCLSARTELTADTPSPIRLKLAPGPYQVPVTSTPAGAQVMVDGKETGLTTPAQLPRQDCTPFTLALVLKGWERKEVRVDPSREASVEVALKEVPPTGTLRVESASGKIQVYEGDRLLGSSGQNLELTAGEHDLTFVDPVLRGSRGQKVDVPGGGKVRIRVGPFETGRVFLYGKPINDGKVYVDGRFLEELPLNGTTPLAVGRHRFQVVSPSGKRVSFSWTLVPGDQSRVVDFDKGDVENP